MYKNKHEGRNNICGLKIKELRTVAVPRLSQRALADKMQLEGIDINKNAIQKIESGERFVTDIEIGAFARVFNVSVDYLLNV